MYYCKLVNTFRSNRFCYILAHLIFVIKMSTLPILRAHTTFFYFPKTIEIVLDSSNYMICVMYFHEKVYV